MKCGFCGKKVKRKQWYQKYCCAECRRKGWIIDRGKELEGEKNGKLLRKSV